MKKSPKIAEFNQTIKNMLFEIEKFAEENSSEDISNISCYYLDWESNSQKLFTKEEDIAVSDKYLDYYWMTFTLNNKECKVTMFYKDFDCKSGNIHVLPGAIQFWEKTSDSTDSIDAERLKLEAVKSYITKYIECGWKPKYNFPLFWNKDNLSKTAAIIWQSYRKNKPAEIQELNTCSTVFYGDIVNIYKNTLKQEENEKIKSGHCKKYALFNWIDVNDTEMKTPYGISNYDSLGYFIKFGECHRYIKQQPGGPNRYNAKKGTWEINYMEAE